MFYTLRCCTKFKCILFLVITIQLTRFSFFLFFLFFFLSFKRMSRHNHFRNIRFFFEGLRYLVLVISRFEKDSRMSYRTLRLDSPTKIVSKKSSNHRRVLLTFRSPICTYYRSIRFGKLLN